MSRRKGWGVEDTILVSLILLGISMAFLFAMQFTLHYEKIIPYKLLYLTAANFVSKVRCNNMPPGVLPKDPNTLRSLVEAHRKELEIPLQCYEVKYYYFDPSKGDFIEVSGTGESFCGMFGLLDLAPFNIEDRRKASYVSILSPVNPVPLPIPSDVYSTVSSIITAGGSIFGDILGMVNGPTFIPYAYSSTGVEYSWDDLKKLIKPPIYLPGVLYGEINLAKASSAAKYAVLNTFHDLICGGGKSVKTQRFGARMEMKEIWGISPIEMYCNSQKTNYYLMPVLFVDRCDISNPGGKYFGYILFVTLPFPDPLDVVALYPGMSYLANLWWRELMK